MLLRRLNYRHSFRGTAIRTCSVTTEAVKEDEIKGWIQKVHRKGAFSFVHIASTSTAQPAQVIVPRDVCRTFTVGSAARALGRWVKSCGPAQEYELIANQFDVYHANEMQPIRGSLNKTRDHPHLRAQHAESATLLQLRSRLNLSTHQYFTNVDFVHIDVPVLSRNDCEGAGETFSVLSAEDEDFFGDKSPVFMPVSSQLHLEAMAQGLRNVYSINKAFRAEKSLTRFHMAEFQMLEAECAFVDSLDQICDIVEAYIKHVVHLTRTEWRNEVDRINSRTSDVNQSSTSHIDEIDIKKSFPRVSFLEARQLIDDDGGRELAGFSKRQELQLVAHFGGPVFLQRFPSRIKPFYMHVNANDEAECFDLLFPLIGELAGGSVREFDHDKLRARLPQKSLDWYLNLRRSGYARSSGFGVGMDRFAQVLFGIDNVKDTIAFPRWYKHCKC